MSQGASPRVDTLSVVVFPQHPVSVKPEGCWRQLFNAEPDKVESFPARGNAVATGTLGEFGFAILQNAFSIQFAIGQPGATPPPPQMSTSVTYDLGELKDALFPLVAKYMSDLDSVVRIGVHSRRVDSVPTLAEANAMAFSHAGVSGDPAGCSDLVFQVNRQLPVDFQDIVLLLNHLRRVSVSSVAGLEMNVDSSGRPSTEVKSSGFEVLFSVDCNTATADYVFTEETPAEVLDLLWGRLLGEIQ